MRLDAFLRAIEETPASRARKPRERRDNAPDVSTAVTSPTLAAAASAE
jgi:hypothetical protein